MSTSLKLFIIGVTASFGPCLLFCSPMVVPYVAATRKGVREGLEAAITFSISRIITFALLGLSAGILGELLLGSLSKSSTGVNILIGAIIITMGGFVISGRDFSPNLCRVCKIKNRGVWDMVLLGVVIWTLLCRRASHLLIYSIHLSYDLQPVPLQDRQVFSHIQSNLWQYPYNLRSQAYSINT